MTAVSRLWSICPRISLIPGWVEDRAIFTCEGRGGRVECVLCCSLVEFLPLSSPLLLFLTITAGVMKLPSVFSASEAQSQWIIIFKIHQQGSCNFERLEGKEKWSMKKQQRYRKKSIKYQQDIQQQLATASSITAFLTSFHLKLFFFFRKHCTFPSHLFSSPLFLCWTHPQFGCENLRSPSTC